jgi:hypothetical protein
LKIYKHGDGYFNESETIIVDVEVTKAPQAQLVITSLPMTVGVLNTPTVSGGSTTGVISLEVLSGPCVVLDLELYGSEVGVCEIRASRDGLTNYQGVVSNTISVSISKASQTIKIYSLSESKTQNSISVTTEITSGLTPTVTTADSAICSATGSTIFTVSEGICSFTVSQAGNSSYLAASPVSASFTINGKADPVISNFADLTKNLGDQFFFHYGAIYNAINVTGTWLFTSSDSDILTVTGDSAVAKKGGLVFVTATFTPENSSSFNTASQTIEVTVLKGLQSTLYINTNSVEFGVKQRISIMGGSTSGFVTYVVDSGNCSIADGVLSSTSGGNCYLTATMAGNLSYENVSSASTLIAITKIEQVPLAITSLYMNFGSTLTLVATGGTGTGALSYVVDSGHCTVSGSTLTATEVDTSADSANDCFVIVTRATDASYLVKSAAKTKITISAGTQSALTITSLTATYGTTYSLTSSGGSNSGSVSYVVASGDCTVSGSTLTNTGAGLCSVVATMASSARYLAVSSTATEITIAKATQSALSISNIATTGTYGEAIELKTTGGTTDGSVTYAVHSGHPCTISGSFLVPTAGGDCGVIATMSGGANYQNVSSSEVTFTFAKKAASITSLTLNKNIGSTIQSLTYQVIGFVNGDSVTAVTTNYEGDTVTYALSTTVPDVAGLYRIKPSAAKLSTGADASTKYEITYTDGALTVYIGVQAPLIITSTSVNVLNILDLTTSGGSGTGAVTYVVNAGSCEIAGGGPQLVPTSGYDCQITATKAGDSEYGEISSESTVIRVIKIAQTLTFDAIADLPLDYVNAYANASSNRSRIVEYSSLTPAVCTSSSYLVDLVSVGTCTLAANQSGDEFVGAAAQVTRSFQITTPYVAPKTAQGPLYIYIPNSSPVVGDSVLVMPYGGTAGTPNVLTIATPNSNNCTLEAITDTQNYWLYAESAGTCRIVFNKMGDFVFDSATAVTADVVFAAPDISAFRVAIEIDSSVTPPSMSADISTQTIDQYGTIATVTFTNSGGAVDSYSYLDLPAGLSFDPDTGKLSGKMSSVSFAFAFGITAINAGGSSMASTLVSFTPINQTILLNQPSDMNLGDVPQTLIATSSSMISVSRFGSSTNATCAVSKGIVTAIAEGTCTITADLPGDQNYADAQQVSVSFTIFPVGGPSVPAPTPVRTITYALGGGSGTVPTHTDVSEGNDFTVAGGSGLTRTGYTFNKWNDGTSNFSDGSIYTVATSNVLLTATWTANAPAPTPVPTPTPAPAQTPTTIQTPTPTPAPITPTISTLVFTENLLKNGGTLSWTGTNIESWRFIGDEKTYPTPFVYGTYTVNWTGNLVNMVTGVKYSLAIEVLSKTSGSQSSSIDYTIEPVPVVIDTSAAEEAAKLKAEQEKAIDDAKAAEAKAIDDAKAAEAKAVEDARIAAEAKAVEDARIAAEAKVATDMKIAEDAAIKISKEKSEAEAQAVKDAANAALAAKRLVLKFSINMPVVKTYLNSETKALIKNYALTLPVNSNVTCIGYTYSSRPTKTELTRAKNEALAACKYIVTIKKGTHYYISVKSWLAIKPKPKAMDTKKLHRLDILSSVPLTIEEIIDMQNLVALVRKDNEWVM